MKTDFRQRGRTRIMITASSVIAASIGGLVLAHPASALTEYTVDPGESAGCTPERVCKTIQDAVNDATLIPSGHPDVTIYVPAGVFAEVSGPASDAPGGVVIAPPSDPTHGPGMLTIQGLGADDTTATTLADHTGSVFAINVDYPVILDGLTITGGGVDPDDPTPDPAAVVTGAGVRATGAGPLTITSSVISDNHATAGGISPTPSNGGGIAAIGAGMLTIEDSTITANSASEPFLFGTVGGNGGGLFRSGGATAILNSVISDNEAGTSKALVGPGTAAAGGSGGGLYVESGGGPLELEDSTVEGNKSGDGADGGSSGGGFPSEGGAGGRGGGIYTGVTTTILRCTVQENSTGKGGNGAGDSLGFFPAGSGGDGGAGTGIFASGPLTVERSTIAHNDGGNGGNGGPGANASGGGFSPYLGGLGGIGGASGGDAVLALGGVVLSNSTVSGNAAGHGGNGGPGGAGTPANDPFSGTLNHGQGGNGGQGGIVVGTGVRTAGTASLSHVTIVGTSGGTVGQGGPAGLGGPDPGGVPGTEGLAGVRIVTGLGPSSTVTLTASLLANAPETNCLDPLAPLTDGGYNAADDTTCDRGGPGNVPLSGALGPLQNNGGPTLTIALLPGNSAIGVVPVASGLCLGTDQRGLPRTSPGTPTVCAAGAYEPQTDVVTPTPPPPTPTPPPPTPTPTAAPPTPTPSPGPGGPGAPAGPGAPGSATCHGEPATIVGTPGNDRLRGTAGRDVIVGRGGNDVIAGRGGNDLICGDAGKDDLRGGYGRDRIYAGNDDDTIRPGNGKDRVHGGNGTDTSIGAGEQDQLRSVEDRT